MAQERRGDAENPDLGDAVQDLWHTLVDYAKQETIEPIRHGSVHRPGTAGSALIAIGSVLLTVALLRPPNRDGIRVHGNLTLIPYLITLVAAAAIGGVAVWWIIRNGKES